MIWGPCFLTAESNLLFILCLEFIIILCSGPTSFFDLSIQINQRFIQIQSGFWASFTVWKSFCILFLYSLGITILSRIVSSTFFFTLYSEYIYIYTPTLRMLIQSLSCTMLTNLQQQLWCYYVPAYYSSHQYLFILPSVCIHLFSLSCPLIVKWQPSTS